MTIAAQALRSNICMQWQYCGWKSFEEASLYYNLEGGETT